MAPAMNMHVPQPDPPHGVEHTKAPAQQPPCRAQAQKERILHVTGSSSPRDKLEPCVDMGQRHPAGQATWKGNFVGKMGAKLR